MAYIRRVVTTLRREGPMCDDCLSTATKITPRQTVALLVEDLVRAERLLRKKQTCPVCGRTKKVSGIRKSKTQGKRGFLGWLLGK